MYFREKAYEISLSGSMFLRQKLLIETYESVSPRGDGIYLDLPG